jgi:hypothetical protein
MLTLPRRCYRAADATPLPLQHCRCGHTAAATLQLLHRVVLANATPAAVMPAAHCCYHTRRLHACRCHTRRYTDRHRHAGTGQQHPSHSTTATGPPVTPHPPLPRPPPRPPTRSPSTPALKPQVNGPRTPPTPLCMASTRAHSGWLTRSCVALPSTSNPASNKIHSKPIRQPNNNHTTTTQQPHNNRTTTVIDPKGGAGATPRHLRYGAAGETGGLPEGLPPPPGPQGRRRHHPSPHCATARRGRPEAHPKGRPNPAGPQGRRRRHPSSSCATARRERPEAYQKGRPFRQKSDPAPPEIGRGSKRALTHRAGKSNRLT